MKKKPVYVETVAQLRALAAPARQEICDCLATVGAATVNELAEHLGRPADALYFHVRRLVKVGLVVELDREKTGRHVTSRYDLAARPLKLKYRRSTKKQVEKVIGAATRAGLRDFEHSYDQLAESQVEGQRDLWAGRAKGWLTTDEVARVNQLLAQIHEILFQGHPEAGTDQGSGPFRGPKLVRGANHNDSKLVRGANHDHSPGNSHKRLFGFTFLLSPSAPPFRERVKKK